LQLIACSKRLVMVRLTLLAGLEFSVTPSVTPAAFKLLFAPI
jgi:hypothetical protein